MHSRCMVLLILCILFIKPGRKVKCAHIYFLKIDLYPCYYFYNIVLQSYVFSFYTHKKCSCVILKYIIHIYGVFVRRSLESSSWLFLILGTSEQSMRFLFYRRKIDVVYV